MESECLLLELLERDDWGEEEPRVAAFRRSEYGALLRDALSSLRREALYMSHVHGVGHIERTMLHGAMCAEAEGLGQADTRLLLTMCAYHDTGRTCDYLDGAHGARSAEKLPDLTDLRGEDLREAMAGIEAHSVGDGRMEEILAKYAPADLPRARLLAQLLKDADGLDRVRIHDLNPAYLRRPRSGERAEFALELFRRYSALERERGEDPRAGGYDLPTIHSVKAFVTECFAAGKNCLETELLALDRLTGGGRAAGILADSPKTTEECQLLTGSLLYLESLCREAGRSREETEERKRALRQRFRSQYGSALCADIRPKTGCGGFAVDGILFSLEQMRKNKIKTIFGVDDF